MTYDLSRVEEMQAVIKLKTETEMTFLALVMFAIIHVFSSVQF